jgi:glucokinase
MKRILAADIGGTHSRFAYFQVDDNATLSLVETKWIDTAKATSFSHLLDLLKETTFSLPVDQSDIAALAVAGPVIHGVYSNPPNIDWDIDVSHSAEDFNLKRCRLVNDFAAQAYACRSPIADSARQVLAGQIDPHATLAVIGAGTGLGMAALATDGAGGYVAIPSEGGHGALPFESPAEFDFLKFLIQTLAVAYVETEYVVSGKGLSLIHQFLTGEQLTPAEVGSSASQDSETIQWMARFYGRACRNYALQVLARGGVYIAGGVAANVPALVFHPEFELQFRNSNTMRAILKSIPVFLNTNEESGLWGAAYFAAQTLKQEGHSEPGLDP